MAAHTYTQANGTEDHTYFMDVEITPAAVADGTLVARFDTVKYPKLGVVTS